MGWSQDDQSAAWITTLKCNVSRIGHVLIINDIHFCSMSNIHRQCFQVYTLASTSRWRFAPWFGFRVVLQAKIGTMVVKIGNAMTPFPHSQKPQLLPIQPIAPTESDPSEELYKFRSKVWEEIYELEHQPTRLDSGYNQFKKRYWFNLC